MLFRSLEYRDSEWDDVARNWVTVYSDMYHYSSQTSIKNIAQTTGDVYVYPNPVQNTLFIQSSEAVEQATIYDISGRMLQQTFNPAQSIDISNLANGIYLVKVKTAAGESVSKIVKQ